MNEQKKQDQSKKPPATTMVIGTLLEVKHPLIHLKNEFGYTIWFCDHKDNLITLNDYAINYPRWTMCIHTREEMIAQAKLLIQEGKEIVHIDKELEELRTFAYSLNHSNFE